MAQTSVDFANSKPERRNLAILLREKKVSAAKKKVSLNVESCSGGLDVVNSRELLGKFIGFGVFSCSLSESFWSTFTRYPPLMSRRQ